MRGWLFEKCFEYAVIFLLLMQHLSVTVQILKKDTRRIHIYRYMGEGGGMSNSRFERILFG